MAYTPTTWANGDTIDATKLNKMEQGIANAGAVMVVELSSATGQADHTFAEIFDALRSGTPVYLHFPDPGATWQSDYFTRSIMLPVASAVKYADMYRVYANYPYGLQIGSIAWLASPAVYVLSAPAPSSYPTFLKVVYAPASYVTTAENP